MAKRNKDKQRSTKHYKLYKLYTPYDIETIKMFRCNIYLQAYCSTAGYGAFHTHSRGWRPYRDCEMFIDRRVSQQQARIVSHSF